MHYRVLLMYSLSFNFSCRSCCLAIITHQGRMERICISKLGHLCLRKWSVACWVRSHYVNQGSSLFNFAHVNKYQWNLNWNTTIFLHGNQFQNIVCEMEPFCLGLNVFMGVIGVSSWIYGYNLIHLEFLGIGISTSFIIVNCLIWITGHHGINLTQIIAH